MVEGNHYFPRNSIEKKYFKDSKTTTHCPWKGMASDYTLEVDSTRNEDAAWYYRTPREVAAEIKDYIGFWRGVEITE